MPTFEGSPYDYMLPLIIIHGGVWTVCVCVFFVRRAWGLLGSI